MITHEQVDAINRFLHTTYGRERACRLLQYFARFYTHYLTRLGASPAKIQRWSSLKYHVAHARKFFRLLKPIEYAQASIKALQTDDTVLRSTTMLKHIGMGLYYSAEVLVLVKQNHSPFPLPFNSKFSYSFLLARLMRFTFIRQRTLLPLLWWAKSAGVWVWRHLLYLDFTNSGGSVDSIINSSRKSSNMTVAWMIAISRNAKQYYSRMYGF